MRNDARTFASFAATHLRGYDTSARRSIKNVLRVKQRSRYPPQPSDHGEGSAAKAKRVLGTTGFNGGTLLLTRKRHKVVLSETDDDSKGVRQKDTLDFHFRRTNPF